LPNPLATGRQLGNLARIDLVRLPNPLATGMQLGNLARIDHDIKFDGGFTLMSGTILADFYSLSFVIRK